MYLLEVYMSGINLRSVLSELSSTATEFISEAQWRSIYTELLKPEIDIDIRYDNGPYKGTSLIWWLAYHGKWDYIEEAVQVRRVYSEVYNTKPPYSLLFTTSRGTFKHGANLISLALIAKQRDFVDYIVFDCECIRDTNFIHDGKECSNLSLAAENGYIEVFLEILDVNPPQSQGQRLLSIEFTGIVQAALENKKFFLILNILKGLIRIPSDQRGCSYYADFVQALIDCFNKNKKPLQLVRLIVECVNTIHAHTGGQGNQNVNDLYRSTVNLLATVPNIGFNTTNLFFKNYLSSSAFSILDIRDFYTKKRAEVLHKLPCKTLLIQKILQDKQWKSLKIYLHKEKPEIDRLHIDIQIKLINQAIENGDWEIFDVLYPRLQYLSQDQNTLLNSFSQLVTTIFGETDYVVVKNIQKLIILYIKKLTELDADFDPINIGISTKLSEFLEQPNYWRCLAECLLIIKNERRNCILRALANKASITKFQKNLSSHSISIYTFEYGACVYLRLADDREKKALSENIADARAEVLLSRQGGSNNELLKRHQQLLKSRKIDASSMQTKDVKGSYTKTFNAISTPKDNDLEGLTPEYESTWLLYLTEKCGKEDNRRAMDFLVFHRAILFPYVIKEMDKANSNPLSHFLRYREHRTRGCFGLLIENLKSPGYKEFVDSILYLQVRINSAVYFVGVIRNAINEFISNNTKNVEKLSDFLSRLMDLRLNADNIWRQILDRIEQNYSLILGVSQDNIYKLCDEYYFSPASRTRYEIYLKELCQGMAKSQFYTCLTNVNHDICETELNKSLLARYEGLPKELQTKIASYCPSMTLELDEKYQFKDPCKGNMLMRQMLVARSYSNKISSSHFVAEELYKKLILIIFCMVLRNLLSNGTIPDQGKANYREEYNFAWRALYKKMSPQISDVICEKMRRGEFFLKENREQLYKSASSDDFSKFTFTYGIVGDAFSRVLKPNL